MSINIYLNKGFWLILLLLFLLICSCSYNFRQRQLENSRKPNSSRTRTVSSINNKHQNKKLKPSRPPSYTHVIPKMYGSIQNEDDHSIEEISQSPPTPINPPEYATVATTNELSKLT